MFTVKKSPGDGHCFIHSVATGIESMHPSDRVTGNEILDKLKNEVISYAPWYIPFVDGASMLNLLYGMHAYIDHKQYDIPFGDIVPQVVANALEMNIVIISKNDTNFSCDVVSPTYHLPCEFHECIFVMKTGLHYDGVIPIECNTAHVLGTGAQSIDSMVPDSEMAFENENVHRSSGNVSCSSEDHVHDTDVIYSSLITNGYEDTHSISIHSQKVNIENKEIDKCGLASLNIVTWNINGLSQDKLGDNILGSMLKRYDIIMLSETWSSDQDDFFLDGYFYYNYPRSYKHPASKRMSGGLGFFIRRELKDGVDIWSYTDDVIAWVILKKDFFGFQSDVYVANVYIVPEGSTYLMHDGYNVLYDHVVKVPNNCEILLCGDYNARTGILPDFDTHFMGSNGDLDQLLPYDCLESYPLREQMQGSGVSNRFSRDKATVNNHGLRLINLCKTAGILIFNGRIGKDKGIGDFTRDDTTGSSVVDYVLGTPKLFSVVCNFDILGKVPESDHRAIAFSLKCKSKVAPLSKPRENTLDWGSYYNYNWTHNDLNNLSEIMIDPISDSFRKSFINSVIDQSDPEIIARRLDQYISQACKRTFRYKINTNKQGRKYPAWYDAECRDKRSLAIKAGERVTNATEKEQQDAACREYRACKQRKERVYYRKCVNDIKTAYTTDRTRLWKLLDKISKENCNPNEPEDCEFYHHFKKLSSPEPAEYFDSEYEYTAIDFLEKYELENGTVTNNVPLIEEILNENVTDAEITFAIDNLKTRKSAGIDGIPAEFIKACRDTLTPHITLAINYIIECRSFPTDWAAGIRSAIYKQGKRNLVDNYRGITILPIMEKIFETVINNRLVFVNEAFDDIDRHNGGFLQGSRTSDNLFVLNGLIERQMALGTPLLVCFVDFSKAFDIINRNILFYKLLSRG